MIRHLTRAGIRAKIGRMTVFWIFVSESPLPARVAAVFLGLHLPEYREWLAKLPAGDYRFIAGPIGQAPSPTLWDQMMPLARAAAMARPPRGTDAVEDAHAVQDAP